jgi:hypothetical protein
MSRVLDPTSELETLQIDLNMIDCSSSIEIFIMESSLLLFTVKAISISLQDEKRSQMVS